MPITFATLQAPPAVLRQGNEDVLNTDDYTDAELQSLEYDSALFHLKLDVQGALRLAPDDVAAFDAVANENQMLLSKALAYKQLEWFYAKIDEGEGSKSRLRLDFYRKAYRALADAFVLLLAHGGVSTGFSTIKR